MQLGMIGLGRMGANMAQRLQEGGHTVVVYDRNPDSVAQCATHGNTGVSSVEDLVSQLPSPRIVWLMVPSGPIVDSAIAELRPLLNPGDIIVDGGNSNFHDSVRRGCELKEFGIHYIDCGTSGGVWGLKNGYCLMIGGEKEAFTHMEPIFKTLAPPNGYAHVGKSGAGHFVKMIHNGIEYGMLEAYGEGFELLHASDFGLDLHQVSQLWMQGSVVRSWLLELAERAFDKEPDLESLKGYVDDSGMGRWTVQEAIDKNVPAPVLTLSLLVRMASRQEDSFSAKVIAALRNEFGGHAVHKE
jgi:6-phosphogluconate dehydrogenase